MNNADDRVYDIEDLKAFSERENEPLISFEEVLKELMGSEK